ncbi:hypothetical protein G210_1682 [Candida maltosa Xu316]|uniref:Monopolar spindle protein 2 n=1 Tax=Candida maltosa (strain Xu316) TaxID=1245528 RepID=M3J702_CANMX|nr:hypothetical protein G210_1682 [Candida maltosa Xu316]
MSDGIKIIDKLVSTCWKIVGNSTDSIFLYQVRQSIQEMQQILQIDVLFDDTESRSIDKYIKSGGSKKISRQEFIVLLDKTVKEDSFKQLLLTRFNLTTRDIERLIERYVENVRSPHPVRNIRSRESLKEKEEYIKEMTKDFTSGNLQFSRLHQKYKEQKNEITQLTKENSDLTNEVSVLRRVSRDVAENGSLTSLKEKLKERELVLNKYKQLVRQLEQREAATTKAVERLQQALNAQNEVVEKLSKKLIAKESETSTIKGFLLKLPLIKQWYLFLKYKQSNKDPKMFWLHIVTILASAWLCCWVVYLLYYSSVLFFSSTPNVTTYIYDKNRSSNRLGSVFGFWRKVPWVEELVYKFIEW